MSFSHIKEVISKALVLVGPYFSRDFYVFSFSSNFTIAGVLLQKNEEGYEKPISFFIKALRDVELNCSVMEKLAYAMVQSLKDFRVYIIHSHIIAFLPNTMVKDILTQPDVDGWRGKWIARLLDNDLEIWPTKLVKGRGLSQLMSETNYEILGISLCETSAQEEYVEQQATVQVSEQFPSSPWYKNIVYFLQTLQCPPNLSKTTARFLKLRAVKFCILEEALFWKDPGGLLLNYVTKDEAKKLTEEFHSGSCGGHLYWKSIVNKILREGFYWPIVFADVSKAVSACHQCHIFEGRRKLWPLKPVDVEAPFQ